MKPKPYRKMKESKGSDMATFKPNEAGGPVEGIIEGPESSIGSSGPSHPSVDQGKEKGIEKI